MGGDVRDVVVVGAGPAGATAAASLAKEGRSVSLVDRATFPRAVSCAGWLNARATAVLDELGVKIKSLRKCALRDVTFHRADFTQSAKPAFEDAPGYLIDRAEFDNALVKSAVAHGAEFIPGHAVADARLKESSVVVRLTDGRALEARLLLLATGRDADLLERVGLIAPRGESSFWSAQVGASLPGGKAREAPRLDAVLGLDNGRSFGLCCLSADRISIGVNWAGELEDAIPALVHLCRGLAEHKVAPIDLSQHAHRAELVRSPAGVALDMESHVGKHTLVIGDAGGFISAVSNEGIYPAMWSAQIAAEVADKALYSVHSQDELMSFDSLWRMRMADYLRSPHTDIQFLLPLVFTNQPMTDRMGAAFFMGDNI